MIHERMKHLSKNDKLSVLAHDNLRRKYSKKHIFEKTNKRQNFILMEYHSAIMDEIINNGRPSKNRKKEIYSRAVRFADGYYWG